MHQVTRFRRFSSVTAALVAVSALALTGCSSNVAAQAPNPSAGAASTTPAAGACGSVPTIAPNDPNGLLKGFSAKAQAGYNAYPVAIQKSAWSGWKPSHAGPFTAVIVGMPPASAFIKTNLDAARAQLKAENIKILGDFAPDSPSNVPLQIQQLQQAINLHPDIIILQAIAPDPVAPLVEAAGKAGIPVVADYVPIDSPYAVTVTENPVLNALEVSAGTLAALGGKGNLLTVTGIPGITNEVFAQKGFSEALKLCPDVKVVSSVNGLFEQSTARQATQQYLAAHPAGVDGVLQSGTMTAGIISAFQQQGLTPPPIADLGASQGSVAWAAKNPNYPYSGSASHAVKAGQTSVEVALRILKGQGPKVNQVVAAPEIFSASALKKSVQSSWSTGDVSDFVGDSNSVFPEGSLDEYFNKPAAQ